MKSMYCTQCGEKNLDESKFCQNCGARMSEPDATPQPKSEPKGEEESSKTTSKTKSDLLWDKFAEVYDAKEEERKKLNSFSSQHIWELIQRLGTNTFEKFIEENKNELNDQPYKTVETLKNLYYLAVLGGYRLKIAESLLEEEKLGKFKSFTLDHFVEEWKKYDFDKAAKGLSEEVGICISRYMNFRINSFFEAVPQAKELPNATVE